MHRFFLSIFLLEFTVYNDTRTYFSLKIHSHAEHILSRNILHFSLLPIYCRFRDGVQTLDGGHLLILLRYIINLEKFLKNSMN